MQAAAYFFIMQAAINGHWQSLLRIPSDFSSKCVLPCMGTGACLEIIVLFSLLKMLNILTCY